MKNFWKYLIPAILGIVIGVFGTLYFNKPKTIPIQVADIQYHDSGVPDSVWLVRLDKALTGTKKAEREKTILAARYRWLLDNPRTVHDTLEVSATAPDDVYTMDDLENSEFASEKTFAWDSDMIPADPEAGDYVVKSLVLGYAPLPVTSFDNTVVVRWNKYYEKNILPSVERQIKKAARENKYKGVIIGALALGGIATRNEYVAAAGLVGAVGLYFFW